MCISFGQTSPLTSYIPLILNLQNIIRRNEKRINVV